jgi:hypothetical protein
LSGNEGFGGGINFVKIYAWAEGGAEFVGERGERDPAVDEAFKVGPQILEVAGAEALLPEGFGEDEDPAGDAGD